MKFKIMQEFNDRIDALLMVQGCGDKIDVLFLRNRVLVPS